MLLESAESFVPSIKKSVYWVQNHLFTSVSSLIEDRKAILQDDSSILKGFNCRKIVEYSIKKFNSITPKYTLTHFLPVPYICVNWIYSALLQIMACPLFGTEPLSGPMLGYCQLDPQEQISVKFQSKFIHFHSRKCIWNCCLRNGGHFVQGAMSWIKLSSKHNLVGGNEEIKCKS